MVSSVSDVQHFVRDESGYNREVVAGVPFKGFDMSHAASETNPITVCVRHTMKWSYKVVELYWTMFEFKRNMRVGKSGLGTHSVAAMLLQNIFNFLYRSSVSR